MVNLDSDVYSASCIITQSTKWEVILSEALINLHIYSQWLTSGKRPESYGILEDACMPKNKGKKQSFLALELVIN